MLFVCKIIDPDGRLRDVACQVSQLEAGLSLVNRLVTVGDQIRDCYILEAGKRTQLSVEAFDGAPMQRPIQALQDQWLAILTQPAGKPVHTVHQLLLASTLVQIDSCEVRMALYNDAIAQLESFKLIALTMVGDAAKINRLVNRYQAQIDTYRRFMILAQAGRDAGLRILARLKTNTTFRRLLE